jgi:hypothetical protein
MYQLRVYTIATPEAAKLYYTVHWKRHIDSLAKFHVSTRMVLCEEGTEKETRVLALVSYEDGADIVAVDEAYMSSAEFRKDMEGFDFKNILKVEGILLSEAPEIAQLL